MSASFHGGIGSSRYTASKIARKYQKITLGNFNSQSDLYKAASEMQKSRSRAFSAFTYHSGKEIPTEGTRMDYLEEAIKEKAVKQSMTSQKSLLQHLIEQKHDEPMSKFQQRTFFTSLLALFSLQTMFLSVETIIPLYI